MRIPNLKIDRCKQITVCYLIMTECDAAGDMLKVSNVIIVEVLRVHFFWLTFSSVCSWIFNLFLLITVSIFDRYLVFFLNCFLILYVFYLAAVLVFFFHINFRRIYRLNL